MPWSVDVVRSIFLWALIGLITLVLFILVIPVALVTLPFDPNRNAVHTVASFWARTVLKVNPAWSVEVQGEDHFAEVGGSGAAVVCANHQSIADIAATHYLRHPFKWIAKQSLAFVPIIGWGMWMSGYIFLRRGNKESIRRCMVKSRRWLDRGVSIMMYPEGTRSPDGRLKAFKDGAFRLSVDAGVPIIPMVIAGTRELVGKGSWRLTGRTHITLRVGPPIRPKAGAVRDREIDRLRDETRGWILANLALVNGQTEAELDASRDMVAGNNRQGIRV